MKRRALLGLILLIVVVAGIIILAKTSREGGDTATIELPTPKHEGEVSVEEAIFKRKSIRRYRAGSLTLQEVSQLLWSAGGKTIDGLTGATRAYPSAGGIYPLEIYLVAGDVEGLADGVYLYKWQDHSLNLVKKGDLRGDLSEAALGQRMVDDAPISLIFTAVSARTERRYGRRGTTRYLGMDVGGAGQNVHLQAEALGLGTVIIGAFSDEAVQKAIGVTGEEPLYIMPVGKPL